MSSEIEDLGGVGVSPVRSAALPEEGVLRAFLNGIFGKCCVIHSFDCILTLHTFLHSVLPILVLDVDVFHPLLFLRHAGRSCVQPPEYILHLTLST